MDKVAVIEPVERRLARPSESYKDEADFLANEKGFATRRIEDHEDTVVKVKIDDDEHVIEANLPTTIRGRLALLRGKRPSLCIHSTYPEEKIETGDTPVEPSTVHEWLLKDVKLNKEHMDESKDISLSSSGFVRLEGTNRSGPKEQAENDLAVRALREAKRVTGSKELWKELQRARRAPQELVYKAPKGYRFKSGEKTRLKGILDAIVKGSLVIKDGHHVDEPTKSTKSPSNKR